MSVEVVHQPNENRFVAQINNKETVLSYERLSNKVFDFTYTFVPEEYRKQGIASELVKQALDIARKEGLKVKPSCPFVKTYVANHKERYENIITD